MEFEDYKADNLERLIDKFLKMKKEELEFDTFCWEDFSEFRRQEDELKWECRNGE